MSETTTNARIDPDRIRVSNHARFRVQQRLGVIERAAEHVRDLLSRSEKVDVEYVRGADAYEIDQLTIVIDPNDDVVTTVFERPEEDR